MALRNTNIMKHDYIGPKASPIAMVVTYRSRKIGSGLPFTYKSVVFSGTHDCVILEWKDETDAKTGHEQTLARLTRGEPVQRMLS